MKASDVMVPDVITAGPDDSVQDVAAALLANRISAVPVVDGTGKLVGIVSEGDLIRRTEIGTERPSSWWLELLGSKEVLAADYLRERGRRVGDVMTRKVVTVTPDTGLAEIASILERHAVKRVPVVADGKLVGIVSRANLLQGIATMTRPAPDAGEVDDRTLRERVMRTLKAEPWAPALLNVTVAGGVVDVWGMVSSETEKNATRVAVEQVPGVKSVVDNLWVGRAVHYGA